MEINYKSQFVFVAIDEISHSLSFFFAEWFSAGEKLGAWFVSTSFILCFLIEFPVVIIVSIQINSGIDLFARMVVIIGWSGTHILSLFNQSVHFFGFDVVLFDQSDSINVHNRNEIILILAEHLLHLRIVS